MSYVIYQYERRVLWSVDERRLSKTEDERRVTKSEN
jgi:hypothetical protein